MSKRFHVYMEERWIRTMAVDAETDAEAIRIVENGGGVEVGSSPEYQDDLPSETWTAEEVES